MKWLAGYGLKKMPGMDHCSPSPRVISPESKLPDSHAWKNPKRPSSTVGGPVNPRATRSAAVTPAWAAHPQWRRLTVPPVRLASRIPDDMEAARPIALAIPSAPSLYTWAAAAAAPSPPQIEVACWPRSKNVELAAPRSYPAIPSRTHTSIPTAAATMTSAPLAPAARNPAGGRKDGRF